MQANSALEPLYGGRAAPNEGWDLYSGDIELVHPVGAIVGSGLVRFEWLPDPHIHFELSKDFNPSDPEGLVGVVELKLLGNASQALAFSTLDSESLHSPGTGTRRISGKNLTAEIGSGQRLDRVLFLVPNFRFSLGTEWIESRDGSRGWSGRSRVPVGDWILIIDERMDRQEQSEALDSEGGFAVTAVGMVARADGAPFQGDEAKDLLSILRYALSISHGYWVEPILPVGLDPDGERVWELWRVGQLTSWRKTYQSWLDPIAKNQFQDLLPGVIDRWQDPDWRRGLQLATGWYVEANTSEATQPRVVVEQICLEMLAWIELVEETAALSRFGFERLPAADRLRLLLTAAKVDTKLPSRLRNLAGVAQNRGWPDGPQAFTELRNAIVHLTKRERLAQSADLAAEAGWLGIHYVELALLHFLRYRGKYRSRFSSAQALPQTVPWA